MRATPETTWLLPVQTAMRASKLPGCAFASLQMAGLQLTSKSAMEALLLTIRKVRAPNTAATPLAEVWEALPVVTPPPAALGGEPLGNRLAARVCHPSRLLLLKTR